MRAGLFPSTVKSFVTIYMQDIPLIQDVFACTTVLVFIILCSYLLLTELASLNICSIKNKN